MNISLVAKHHAEKERLTQLVAEIALEQGRDIDDRPHRATAPGDERRLRGIPICAPGVGGAIPGTRPDAARL